MVVFLGLRASDVKLLCGYLYFIAQVIYNVVKVKSWHTLNALLELVSFRVHHHIPQTFRFKLIGNFAMVASVGNVPNQLYIR